MRILITGANGFIGRGLSSRLITRGHYVFGLSLNGPSGTSLRFKDYFRQDITRPFSLAGHFDFVVHLAAYNITHIGDQDTRLYTATNSEGTKNLLRAVDAKKIIYLSTAKVYKNEGLPLTEDSLLAPQGAYAQSKLKGEEECRAFLKKESLVILRSVNVMGWGQAPKAVLPIFFQRAKNGQTLDIIGPGNTPMQFVYAEDLVDAIEAAMDKEESNGVFNIAHKETVTLEKLAQDIIEAAHSRSALNVTENAAAAIFSPVVCDKAYQQLGWKAKTGISGILGFYGQEYARKN